MIFHIEKLLLCKSTFDIGENYLFVDSVLQFICLPEVYLMLIPPRNSSCHFFPWKIIFLEIQRHTYGIIINICSKNWLLTVIPKRYFYYWGKWTFLLYVFFSTFYSRKSSYWCLLWEILPIIFPPREYYSWECKNCFWNTECLF